MGDGMEDILRGVKKDLGLKSVEQIDREKEKAAKPRMDLLPGKALLAVARVMGFGAGKHGKGTWKNYDSDLYKGAAGRHWAALLDGEKTDPETGESHWAHLACCALFELWKHENKY